MKSCRAFTKGVVFSVNFQEQRKRNIAVKRHERHFFQNTFNDHKRHRNHSEIILDNERRCFFKNEKKHNGKRESIRKKYGYKKE